MSGARAVLALAIAGVALGGCGRQVHLGSIGDGAANLLWSATFEPGDVSEWSADGQGGVDAENIAVAPVAALDVAHTGRYAGKATVMPSSGMDSINYFYRLQPSPTEAYYAAWFYVPPTFTVGSWLSIIHFRGSHTGDGANVFPTWDINLYSQPDGSLTAQLYNYVTLVDLQQPNPVAVPVGRWVHFEVFLRKAAAPTGELKVWQDDVPILDAQGVVTAETDWTEWSVGGSSDDITPATGLVYVDDATISVNRLGGDSGI
ncbi:MAG TPA: heparin lyase I family protein [Polyangia bacterium]|nr:heparin lyase I family protein [Polyangia bacterium]